MRFQNTSFYQEFKTPANYLNTQMKYNPPKTMAKYLDEFNWVKVRYEIPLLLDILKFRIRLE